MKKLTLCGTMAVLLLFSCDKETKKNNPAVVSTTPTDQQTTNKNIDYVELDESKMKLSGILAGDLFNNSYIGGKLNSNNLSYAPNNPTLVYSASTAKKIYLRTLNKTNNTNGTNYHLFMMSTNDNFSNIPILTETSLVPEGRKVVVKSLINNVEIINVTVSLQGVIIKINDILQGGITSGGTGGSPTCNETNTNFSDCFKCSMNELNEGVLGTIMCTVNPWACIIASSIHCAALAPPGPNGDYTYEAVSLHIDAQISKGFYTGRENITYNSKNFIFLY